MQVDKLVVVIAEVETSKYLLPVVRSVRKGPRFIRYNYLYDVVFKRYYTSSSKKWKEQHRMILAKDRH